MSTRAVSRAIAVIAAVIAAPLSHAQSFSETEPNDSKTLANACVFTGTSGTITGTTTGSVSVGGTLNSTDVFRVRSAAAALAIYRHRLTLTSTITGHTYTLRGLPQSNGVIGTSDIAFQTSSASSSPARTVQWYGFGREEEVYVRVTGLASTTDPYTLTYSRSSTSPLTASGLIYSGTISMYQFTATNVDLWLYDSNMQAIPAAGNDTYPTSGFQARLTRNLSPGTYTMAIGRENLGNNLSSPPDDLVLNGNVLDFPDAVATSSVGQASATLSLVIDDGINPLIGTSLSFANLSVGHVEFVRFTVTASPAGRCCAPDGACTTVSRHLCTGESTWTNGGTCSPNPCVPANNLCSGAFAFSAASVAGTTENATAETDELLPCMTGASVPVSRGVWYTYTVPAGEAGWHTFYAPPAVLGTVTHAVGVYSACGGSLLACGDVQFNPSGPLASASAAFVNLAEAQTVRVLVMNVNNSATGPFNLFVDTGTAAGACCAPSGFCGVYPSATCAFASGFTYLGSGTTCSPNPCPQPGRCCTASLTCTFVLQSNCAASSNWTIGGACTPNPCPPSNNLCANAAPATISILTDGTTLNATTDPGETLSCISGAGFSVHHGVWYSVTNPFGGNPRWFSFTAYPSGSSPIVGGAFVGIFSSCGGVELSCGAFTGWSGNGQITAYLNMSSGQNVRVLVCDHENIPGLGGTFSLYIQPSQPAGACCFSDGTCSVYTASICSSSPLLYLSPVYQGDGTVCNPNTCPPAGACCSTAGNCSFVTSALCTGGSTFLGGACSPNLCTPGACCSGSTCLITITPACTGTFVGFGAACNAPGNTTTPCCFAEFNQSGTISVQDIFEFLNAWFAGDPRANFNGAGLSVQDIFDFLNGWFAGC